MNYPRIVSGVALGVFAVLPFSAFALVAMPPVACTMDAKMCPDGSYVGRTGPSCEFQACPGVTEPAKPPYSPAMPPYTPDTTIKRGASGDDVKDMQMMLKSDPAIYSGPVTGYYGALTEAAIKKLQAKYGIPVTGIIDTATRAIIFPPNPNVSVTVVSPNGGEAWKIGDVQHISWKTTYSPVVAPMTMSGASVPVQTTSAGAPVNQDRMIMQSSSMEMQAMPIIMPVNPPVPTPVPDIKPFFSRGTLELIKDGDTSFSRVIGTVNLYDTTRAWKIPASIPEAKDYRIRISVGSQTPCVYRKEVEAQTMGKTLDTSMMNPCPMNTGVITSASLRAYPQYGVSDVSDATFGISSGAHSADVVALKQRIAALEELVQKLQAELARVKEAVNALQ